MLLHNNSNRKCSNSIH